VFFLDLLCWVAFGWNTVGANVGGIRKFEWNPRTREKVQ
jgi:hypothetical protein